MLNGKPQNVEPIPDSNTDLIHIKDSAPKNGADLGENERKHIMRVMTPPENRMNLEEFVTWTKKSTQVHVRIISWYASKCDPLLHTKEQWKQYLKRHLRAAKNLSSFTVAQVERAYKEIMEDEYLTSWTLETILKKLTSAKKQQAVPNYHRKI
jgi:hypothetical protein